MAKPIPFDGVGSSSRSPSSALLSILAILVSSSTANGSPAPPYFLCPSLSYNIDKSTTITPCPSQPTSSAVARRIPKKFAQGDDGLWRPVDSYTLYGSTVPCIGACLRPTQIASSSDDQLHVSGDHTTSASSTPTEDIRDSLPLGWNPISKPDQSRTSLILVLSLVLALFICFFIIGCVFWRKSIIKRRRRDLEAEFKKHQSVPSAAEEAKNLAEKESKAKQKILARATARWKANVRHAARQRKGKRVAASKSCQVYQSSHSSNASRSRLAFSVSLPPSRPSSRRPSIVSLPDDLPQPIISELLSSMSLSHDTTSTVTTSPHTNISISPPAYHHGGQASPIICSRATPLDRSRRPSQSLSFRARIDPHCSGISTPKPFHTAHVATDDKALLARLADLASKPPEETSTDILDAYDTHVLAPAWHDELEEIPLDLITSNDHLPDISCAPSSLFPPPPSQGRMAATDLYEYSFSFDMAALEPEPEPSAPPFQPDSAPFLDDHQIVPSAPPLIDDTELLTDVHPSAPQWESMPCQLEVGEENPAGQGHDRMASAEVPLSGLPPPASVQPVSASQQDIGTGDDIILPGYRP